MNETTSHPEDDMAPASREEMLAALFANMVIQQTNMAMMLLGKVAHPETGKFIKEIDAARMFIDQLEMLEAKTKGNLSKQEENLLKQALSALHMSFVEAVDGGRSAPEHGPAEAPTEHEAPKAAPEQPAAAAKPAEAPSGGTASDESRKKFSKKY